MEKAPMKYPSLKEVSLVTLYNGGDDDETSGNGNLSTARMVVLASV